jgi:hypothetical protein
MVKGWSPRQAITLERRHIIEAEKRIARQEVLVKEAERVNDFDTRGFGI